MKILNFNKFTESKGITKEELVDKIKFYTSYIETYMKDHNKYTTGNLNFHFSYHKLDINKIFKISKELDYNSDDGLIRAICNELVMWGRSFDKESQQRLYSSRYNKEFEFDYNYVNYDEEYKIQNKRELYDQPTIWCYYQVIGKKIENLIKDTKWDLIEVTEFTDDDRELVKNCLINDYDVNDSDDIKVGFNKHYNTILISGVDNLVLEYDTEFIEKLQYYFGGVVILKDYDGTRLYLPFKNISNN